MLNKEVIIEITNRLIQETDLFVVDIVISAGNDIEVVVDSSDRVCLDQCATLSKAMQAELDAICDDYSLMVASAGIGSNLKDDRQIAKTVGKPISVVMNDGEKIIGDLVAFSEGVMEIVYMDKVAVEGKKRKESVEVKRKIAVLETKTIVEELKIK